jgi:hypothetical protein
MNKPEFFVTPGYGEYMLNKLHYSPTFRWILQKFQGIHLVTLNGLQQITNLSVERQLIIRLLGPPTCRYYLLTELSPTCGM